MSKQDECRGQRHARTVVELLTSSRCCPSESNKEERGKQAAAAEEEKADGPLWTRSAKTEGRKREKEQKGATE